MSILFGRRWKITVGTVQFTDIDVSFRVKKTLKPEPNTCELRIYNLKPSSRKAVEQNISQQKVPVTIEAGYESSGLAQIYKGDLRAGWTITEGADIVTELTTGDGEKTLATARMNVPVGPGTQIGTVVNSIVDTLGIGRGNSATALAALQLTGQTTFSAKGSVLKGNAADHMTDLCKSAGLEWSIQDNAVQILTLGQPLSGQALLLSSSTGLVGSVSTDSKGLAEATVLMIPGIRPGQAVQFSAAHVKGRYRIVTAQYEGDTLGNTWYVKFQAEIIK